MRKLSLYRYHLAKANARMQGQPVRRKALVTQSKTISHAEFTQLPSQKMITLQDLDPESPTFGKFYFMPDYDTPDDPNHPIQ